MNVWHMLVGVLFLVICVLLILIVLLQKGKGGGLGAAFGGAGSSAFGTKTGDVFTWITIVLTGLFLLLAVGTNLLLRPPPGFVAAPTFQPPAGPISETVQVSLGCETLGTEIRFTTDGQVPDENSPVYRKKTIPVKPGETLQAKAFRDDWTPSPVAIGAYPKADANMPASPPIGGPTSMPGMPVIPSMPTTAPASVIPTTAPASVIPTTVPVVN